jgi:hypothetical protein
MTLSNPISIIPAEKNWRAAFVNQATKDIFEYPVVAWALCSKEGGHNQVSGIIHMEGKMVPVCDCPNFIGYLEPLVTKAQFLRRLSPT